MHDRRPRGRAFAGVILFGALQFGLSFALAYWALLKVPPGRASVVFASVPLFTTLFAVAVKQEAFRWRSLAGACVALLGITLIFARRAGIDVTLSYLAANVGAAVSFALVPVVVKSFPSVPQASMNAVAMLTGASLLLSMSLLTGEDATLPPRAATWIAHFYLIGPGSIGAFALLLFLLHRWPASAVSYQGVLSPIVAIVLSAWLLEEPVSGGLLAGSSLVLLGVYVGVLSRSEMQPQGDVAD